MLKILCIVHYKIFNDSSCSVCDCDAESVIHILKSCSYARLMWAVSLFPNVLFAYQSVSMCEWLDLVRQRVSKDELVLFVAICWRILGNRDKKVPKNVCLDAQYSFVFTQDFLLRLQQHMWFSLVHGHPKLL